MLLHVLLASECVYVQPGRLCAPVIACQQEQVGHVQRTQVAKTAGSRHGQRAIAIYLGQSLQR
jgi:hypothetical protein